MDIQTSGADPAATTAAARADEADEGANIIGRSATVSTLDGRHGVDLSLRRRWLETIPCTC
jgi:hypothetical protein